MTIKERADPPSALRVAFFFVRVALVFVAVPVALLVVLGAVVDFVAVAARDAGSRVTAEAAALLENHPEERARMRGGREASSCSRGAKLMMVMIIELKCP